MKIGVVGYSAGKFSQLIAKHLVEIGFEYMVVTTGDDSFEIVSGYTDLGIPGLAYRHAVETGHRTVGIACKKAAEYDCFPTDETIIVGDNWGDESNTFLKSIDGLIRIGGGPQSFKEATLFRQMKPDAPIIEMELRREE